MLLAREADLDRRGPDARFLPEDVEDADVGGSSALSGLRGEGSDIGEEPAESTAASPSSSDEGADRL